MCGALVVIFLVVVVVVVVIVVDPRSSPDSQASPSAFPVVFSSQFLIPLSQHYLWVYAFGQLAFWFGKYPLSRCIYPWFGA